MPAPSPFRKYTAAFVAIGIVGSSAASAAPAGSPRAVAPGMVDPLAVVSVFGTASSRAAICAAGASATAAATTATAAAAQAPGATGCVLPVVDAPPQSVAETPPAAVAPIPPPSTGMGAFPLLAGLAAVVGLAAIVLLHDSSSGEIDLPISP